jgi:dGTPase
LIHLAGGLDLDVVEAAALAHDIGHPPFGHVAEEELKEKLHNNRMAGFEGNAQSFRVLTELAVHDTIYPGLNLTRATLSAASKYPWYEEPQGTASRKWGIYSDQQADFEFSRGHLPATWRTPTQQPSTEYRTLEAEVMDWADDVAYAIHDLEDFVKAGLIPLDKLRFSSRERQKFVDYRLENDPFSNRHPEEIEQTVRALLQRNSPFVDSYSGSHRDRARLRRFSSGKIGSYISGPRLVEASNLLGWSLEISPSQRLEVSLLKGLLWYYVIESPSLVSSRLGYARIVGDLFDMLADTEPQGGSIRRIYPRYFSERLEEDSSPQNTFRTAADFIASLTETQITDLYRRLTGMTVGDPLDKIIH